MKKGREHAHAGGSVPPLSTSLRFFELLFTCAHLLPLSWPICLHRSLISLSLHIAPLSLFLPPVPQGDTFYIFSAYPYFSAVTEFLSLDHCESLGVCVCVFWHMGRNAAPEREGEREERERAVPNYVSTLGLRVSPAFSLSLLCTTVKWYWSISQALCLQQQHTLPPLSTLTKALLCMWVCVTMKYEKS